MNEFKPLVAGAMPVGGAITPLKLTYPDPFKVFKVGPCRLT